MSKNWLIHFSSSENEDTAASGTTRSKSLMVETNRKAMSDLDDDDDSEQLGRYNEHWKKGGTLDLGDDDSEQLDQRNIEHWKKGGQGVRIEFYDQSGGKHVIELLVTQFDRTPSCFDLRQAVTCGGRN